jgi:hypothetical protein
MAERRVLQPWEREALRVCNTDLMQDIVKDNRPARVAAPSANVTVVGSGRVQDFDYGPKYRAYKPPEGDNATPADRSGFQEGRPLRPPEGINYVDALCQEQDLRDLEARCREQAARMGISYPDWLKLMEKDLRERRERKEKAAKDRKETPK